LRRATLKGRPKPIDFGHLPLRMLRFGDLVSGKIIGKSLVNDWDMMVNDG
jgi:hypothetical protein